MKYQKLLKSVSLTSLALVFIGCGPSYEDVKPAVVKTITPAKATKYISLDNTRTDVRPYLDTNVAVVDLKSAHFTSQGNVIAYLDANKYIKFYTLEGTKEINIIRNRFIGDQKLSPDIEDVNIKSYRVGENVFDLSAEHGIAYIEDKRKLIVSPSVDFSSLSLVQNKKSRQLNKHRFYTLNTKSDIRKLAFTPNKKSILLVTADNKLTLWDYKKRKVIKTLTKTKSDVLKIQFSQSGDYLAYADEMNLYVWDMNKNKNIASFEQRHTTAITFSSDEKEVASTGDFENVLVYDISKKVLKQQFKHAHAQLVYGLVYDPQDDEVIITAGQDGALKTWFLKNPNTPSSVKYYANKTKRTCDAEALMQKYLSAPSEKLNAFADKYKPKYTSCNVLGNKKQIIDFSNRGILDKFVDANMDALLNKHSGVKNEWERIAYEKQQSYLNEASKKGLKVTGNSKEQKLKKEYDKLEQVNRGFLYQMNSGSYYGLTAVNGNIMGFGTGEKDFFNYGKLAGQAISLADPYQTREYFRFNSNNAINTYSLTHKMEFYAGMGRYDEIIPKNDHQIIAAKDNLVEVWDYKNYILENKISENGRIYALAYDQKNDILAIGSSSKVIKLWDLKNMKLIKQLSGHTENILSLQFINDGAGLMSASYDKTVRVWDIKSGKTVKSLSGFERAASRIHLSPDNKTFLVVSVGDLDSSIKIYDLQNFSLIKTISPEAGRISGIEYIKNGAEIVLVTSGIAFEKDKGNIAIIFDAKSYKQISRNYFSPYFNFTYGIAVNEGLNTINVIGSSRYISVLDLTTLKQVTTLDNGPVEYGSDTIDAVGKTLDNKLMTGNRQGQLKMHY